MAPSAFIILDALPLTPNGKVDREALPAPNQDRPMLEEEFVAPRNPVEETLTSIWSEVLNIARVGVHDNFFELGGNSLQATQILSRLREELKVELSLGAFFESPTVAGLSEAVVRSDTVVADGSRMAALPRGDRSLEDLLSEVDQLSDNEARAILSREREGSREVDSEP
jgi:acyl carrier protein